MRSSKTAVLKVDPRRPDAAAIACGARVIREGGLVGFPTETVYGLAAHRSDRKAIDRLYAVKKRSRGKPLTIHISDTTMICSAGCRMTGSAKILAKNFWPGPLTILLKSAGGRKIGFRMPANTVALRLIAASKVPVVAPSANLSGKRPPTSAAAVLKGLGGKIDLVLDGGRTAVGIESTVIDVSVSPAVILREGAIKARVLAKFIDIA